MSEFNHHASKEKELSFEKRQEMLSNTNTWARHIFDTKRQDEDADSIALTAATPKELIQEDKQGTLAVYDLIDAWHIEYSITDPYGDAVGMIHYYQRQTAGGIWTLSTTDDLYKDVGLSLQLQENRGYVLCENEDLFSKREPLYPELLKPATNEELGFFHTLIERGAFGDDDFDFSELDSFMKRTETLWRILDHLEKNNPD